MIIELCSWNRKYKPLLGYFASWKYLAFLAILALALQVVSFSLSWWVQIVSFKRDSEAKHLSTWKLPIRYQIPFSLSEVLESITRSSVLDSSGEFKFAVRILAPNSIDYEKNKNAITLVSQCSLSRLHYLPELAKRWEGPLSIAVFLLPGEIEFGVRILLLLRRCYSDINLKGTFSFAYPLSSRYQSLALSLEEYGSCDKIFPYFSNIKRSNYDFGNISYPNNLLRNVARKAVNTDYIFVVDIDMIPSQHLHTRFQGYLKVNKLDVKLDGTFKKEVKTAWVVPSFEIDVGAHIPDNKSDLLVLRESGKARPFYQELCWKCQKYTEYEAWEKQKPSSGERDSDSIKHLYEVLWRDPWEPFYISKTNIPLYDERFRQYGFNRISQVCELHVAGYRFLVLDSAFVVHKGFKKMGKLHKKKDEELEKNRVLFRLFKANLKEKYPESSRRCY